MAAALRFNASQTEGRVYFLETIDRLFIKIGHSKRVLTRLAEFGTLRPTPFSFRILGVMPGTQSDEKKLHHRFAHLRDNGEWFHSSVELRDYIAELGLTLPTSSHKRHEERRKQTAVPLEIYGNPCLFCGRDFAPETFQNHLKQCLRSFNRSTAIIAPNEEKQKQLITKEDRQIISEYLRGLAKKRAASQSPERRRELARRAIRTRWSRKKKKKA